MSKLTINLVELRRSWTRVRDCTAHQTNSMDAVKMLAILDRMEAAETNWSNEVQELSDQLEAAEKDYAKLLKRDTENLGKLIKAEATIARQSKQFADELEAALPTWTKISDDPDTWPDDGQQYYLAPTNRGHCGTFSVWSRASRTEYLTDGRWSWRPICTLDVPPEAAS